ncbi:hypothetical protein Ae168Ps1_0738 [Pseudonocardia sp. Ae168_Ps1]|uniref:cupin domain-containing protein n=1 Tax=unclassified Pseudonocardia TaxID=2619320 RepID=UPI0001FFDADD|nr:MULTISPECIES: cupin domain-containing protein [unclassified Pseudonocardia]OLL72360.1 hypothetical protein Ae150APs1_0738 [Pseudonocardia sp. Ae150A_Ps1]OLL78332.1 hypothetical protein Ae168Ps1_0738 [Pseudonocardia sp. Ae168_Ps1]OLL87542.1 hypothetical protein Ae263Ps1_4597c [Pseudonocardia sp. Ae263_Ps1]OLL92428.1 hypothetical protein Ae356Ps1_2325 [Pseudonocardia sp. Ae356_Ps1]OLM18933.1 hypothetical protein Ae707Ps1_3192 [Pseudonocardia sp. Ae707_Ps1]
MPDSPPLAGLRFPGGEVPAEVRCDDLPLFDGPVWTRIARRADAPGGLTVMATRFAAGAGTAWHHHDSDQTLVLSAGRGAVEYADGRALALSPGDVVTVAAGERHRHLAGADGMTHLSVTTLGDTHLDP